MELDLDGPLFHPVKNNSTGRLNKSLNPASVYRSIVRKYSRETGLNVEVNGLFVHSMRATAATTRLPMPQTSPKCRSGWATPTSPPPASMTAAAFSRKIPRYFM
jgi:hypothetical protein